MEWGPRSSGVGFFCFVSPRAWKQKTPTPLDRGPPLHVNRVLVSFCILWCSNFCFIQTQVSSFALSWHGVFCDWTLSTRTVSPECRNYIGGPGAGFPGKILKIGISETPWYPAFPGSNAINSYVYFVELFSESRYSWFPSRSTKIHDSQVFNTKIHDSYMFCNYDSWFMIPLPPPIEKLSFVLV